MIESISGIVSVTLLVLVAVFATRRIVVAEYEAGSGSPDPSPRSARVRALDGYLLVIYTLLAASLAIYLVAGLQ